MSEHSADAIIVGGGLAGLACAHALAKVGVKVIHLAPPSPIDRRTSALMGPSAVFLGELGLFSDPDELGTPLKSIRIIDATSRLIRAPETVFDSAEAGLDSFAWNFPNSKLTERFDVLAPGFAHLHRKQSSATALERTNGQWNVTLADGTVVSAPLIVGADGKNSFVRQEAGIDVRRHDFDQAALVCDLDLGHSLNAESVEFHYEQGPFTLVPAGGSRANLVWIDRCEVLDAAHKLNTEAFADLLLEKSQRLFGTLKPTSGTFVFPLSSLSANVAGCNGVVLVGESAHAFPPIGAQGLNLGLRDVANLAENLTKTDKAQPDWAEQVSKAYATTRKGDVDRTGTFVDMLFRSLLSSFIPAQALRASGLWALKLSPNLRQSAFKLGMGDRSSSQPRPNPDPSSDSQTPR